MNKNKNYMIQMDFFPCYTFTDLIALKSLNLQIKNVNPIIL